MASGGVPCGEWPDIKLAKDLYVNFVGNEITLADKGYKDRQYFKNPENIFEKRVLARHETLNGKLKNFYILKNRFRHPLQKHPIVFHACVNVVQVLINEGEKLFTINWEKVKKIDEWFELNWSSNKLICKIILNNLLISCNSLAKWKCSFPPNWKTKNF